ncbi:hypothetical protein VNO80_21816 [Phaseolus coccineus]|uniref:Uncharacterized protein n=1 Tax=Phaseolus coccineus TaxID=3886 RepID=A0AAN9M8R4_PHACN
MSLDFHPKKKELFCFCDGENEIRYWNINSPNCSHVTKGGNTQVRFQPRLGQFLAAPSDKGVSIFDVEADKNLLPAVLRVMEHEREQKHDNPCT